MVLYSLIHQKRPTKITRGALKTGLPCNRKPTKLKFGLVELTIWKTSKKKEQSLSLVRPASTKSHLPVASIRVTLIELMSSMGQVLCFGSTRFYLETSLKENAMEPAVFSQSKTEGLSKS
jgi:hypothetical protein